MRDEWFIRGKVPMTKSEVRTVSLSKLELYEDCEFWDIGAGNGFCQCGSGGKMIGQKIAESWA